MNESVTSVSTSIEILGIGANKIGSTLLKGVSSWF